MSIMRVVSLAVISSYVGFVWATGALPANATELLHFPFEQVDGAGTYTTPDTSGRNNTGELVLMDNTNLVAGGIAGNAMNFNGGKAGSLVHIDVPDGNADFDRSYTEFTFAA